MLRDKRRYEKGLSVKIVFYSLLSATTGSFFAALLEGIMPAMSVKSMLIRTSVTAAGTGRNAFRLLIPVRLCKMILIGIHSR